MSRFSIKVIVLLLVCSAFTNILAQSKVDDPFRFSVKASAELNDNRDSTPDKQNSSDYFLSPRFQINSMPGDASTLDLVYNPVYKYRTKPNLVQNDSEVYHNASLTFNKRSSEILSTRLVDVFNYTDDPAVTQDGTLLRRDSSYIYNKIEAGMNRVVQVSDVVDISASYAIKKYDEKAVADQSDEDNYLLKGLYLLQYLQGTALAFEGELGGTSYKELYTLDRSFISVMGAVGLEHIASPSLRMGARLGAQLVAYSDADLGSEVSPMVLLSVTGSTIPTVNITGSVSHRIRESDVYPFASQEATDLRAEINWDIPEKSLQMRGSALYHIGRYSLDSLPAALGYSVEGDETITVVEGGATYNYNTTTDFSVLLRSEKVSSDDALSNVSYPRNFTRNSVTLSVARQF